MTEETVPPREQGRVYIDEVARIVHRKVDTVRKWETGGKLPKHLASRRGTRGWRYWTPSQVYGPRGILHWMDTHDMRPGRAVTDPDREAEHIEHLRRPKGISEEYIQEIRELAKKQPAIHGAPPTFQHTRAYLIKRFFPKTRYSSRANFERAIVKYFTARGWDFPPPARKKRKRAKPKKRRVRVPEELRALEREADRIIRLTDRRRNK